MCKDNNDKILYELARQCNNYGYVIPNMTLSAPLYRYRSNLEYALDEIENEYIYLSPIDKLNDPFDSSYKFTYEEALKEVMPAIYFWKSCCFLEKKTWYDELNEVFTETETGKKEMSMGEFFSLLEEKVSVKTDRIFADAVSKIYYSTIMNRVCRRKIGNVACFSEVKDSITMWAYYADSHKGVCLKYEPCLLDESNPEYKSILTSIRKVWYSNIRFEDKEGKYSSFVKSSVWSHEHEWRLWRESLESPKIEFPCLTAVYLGVNFNCENDNLDRIVKALSKKNRKIDLYYYSPSQTEFSLREMRINYKNN